MAHLRRIVPHEFPAESTKRIDRRGERVRHSSPVKGLMHQINDDHKNEKCRQTLRDLHRENSRVQIRRIRPPAPRNAVAAFIEMAGDLAEREHDETAGREQIQCIANAHLRQWFTRMLHEDRIRAAADCLFDQHCENDEYRREDDASEDRDKS